MFTYLLWTLSTNFSSENPLPALQTDSGLSVGLNNIYFIYIRDIALTTLCVWFKQHLFQIHSKHYINDRIAGSCNKQDCLYWYSPNYISSVANVDHNL